MRKILFSFMLIVAGVFVASHEVNALNATTTSGNNSEATTTEIIETILDEEDTELACTEEYDPVCGEDGITYFNNCHAGDIIIDYEGECNNEISEDANEENSDFNCTQQYEPVCGEDGLTYSNSCHAAIGNIAIDHEGACGDTDNEEEGLNFDCTEQYDPVCGKDGITYLNSCHADINNMGIDYKRACGDVSAPVDDFPVLSKVSHINNFHIADIWGQKNIYQPFEPINVNIKAVSSAGPASETDGFDIRYYIYEQKKHINEDRYLNPIYSDKDGYWHINDWVPEKNGQYFLEIVLYCGGSDLICWNGDNAEIKEKIAFVVSGDIFEDEQLEEGYINEDYDDEDIEYIHSREIQIMDAKQTRQNAKNLLSDNKLDAILAELKQLRSVVKEQQTQIKHLKGLVQNVKEISEEAQGAISNFITYGVDDNTQKLGEGERAAVMFSYKAAFDKLPETEEELADAIKIANGRWPSITSDEAEKKLKLNLRKYIKEMLI